MNVLITGASGFAGRNLLGFLAEHGHPGTRLFAQYRTAALPAAFSGTAIRADLGNSRETRELIRASNPDCILHLAGRTSGTRDELFCDNALAAGNLLDAARAGADSARIVLVSSAAVYGYAGGSPIPETAPYAPVSDYGAAKAAEELIAHAAAARYGLQIAVARPFNLCGPGQPSAFALGSVIRQTVELEHGAVDRLHLYSMDSRRDFIDVRDAVAAFWSIATHPSFGSACAGRAFNVASGKSASVREILACIGEIRGRNIPFASEQVREMIPGQVADISRIREVTGWQPSISLARTLQDMLAAEEKRR
ncbi:MAG: NAD-dependent epimerase/dehydratase family protein [Methanomicrobiales archaeon]|nr:NAD-dependent epimerase/dehydratase family protein [Methanomicrobiales archaeon]